MLFVQPGKHTRAWPLRGAAHPPEGGCPACPHEYTCSQPTRPQDAMPGKGGSRLTPEPYATAAARGPRVPNPEHGARTTPSCRRPQAAWTVHCTPRRPRTLVPAAPIKGTPLSNPEGPRRGTCRRPARNPRVAARRWLIPQL